MLLRRKRLWMLISMMVSLLVAVGFILYALSQNIDFYRTPTQLKELIEKQDPKLSANNMIRLGGMVVQGSIIRGENLAVQFEITDYQEKMTVVYNGILPDLFREGQGIVAQGYYAGNQFEAKTVLAKHDEKYMPPEIARSMRKP